MIRFTCRCEAKYTISDDLAGRPVRCPQCGAKGQVPHAKEPSKRLKVPSEEDLAEIDLDKYLDGQT